MVRRGRESRSLLGVSGRNGGESGWAGEVVRRGRESPGGVGGRGGLRPGPRLQPRRPRPPRRRSCRASPLRHGS
jgi:hypothetical protein